MTNAKFLYFVMYGMLGLVLHAVGLGVSEKPLEFFTIYVVVGVIDIMSAITATKNIK